MPSPFGNTVLDQRNDPAGYPPGETPQRYRIRKVVRGGLDSMSGSGAYRYQLRGTTDPEYVLGDVEEHQTIVTFDPHLRTFFHGLAPEDQLYADLCTRLVQRACSYFYDMNWTPMPHTTATVSDQQVHDSIHTLDLGENRREALRMDKPRWDLTKLPWQEQRALVMALYALRDEWGFEKLGPVENGTPAPDPEAFALWGED